MSLSMSVSRMLSKRLTLREKSAFYLRHCTIPAHQEKKDSDRDDDYDRDNSSLSGMEQSEASSS